MTRTTSLPTLFGRFTVVSAEHQRLSTSLRELADMLGARNGRPCTRPRPTPSPARRRKVTLGRRTNGQRVCCCRISSPQPKTAAFSASLRCARTGAACLTSARCVASFNPVRGRLEQYPRPPASCVDA